MVTFDAFVGSILDAAAVTRRLSALGWIPGGAVRSAGHLSGVVADYQSFHGLPVTGDLTPATERSLTAPRICSLPDRVPVPVRGLLAEAAPDLAKWPDGFVIRWYFPPVKMGRLDPEAAAAAFEIGVRMWERVCGVKFARAVNEKTANLIVTTKGMDGAAGTLAAADFPDGKGSQRTLNFDGEEAWVADANPPRLTIDLVRVASHELGHVLGIPHIAAGNLLQAKYSVVREPQPGDIMEAVARYGPPAKPEPAASAPSPTLKLDVSVELDPKSLTARVVVPGFRVVPG